MHGEKRRARSTARNRGSEAQRPDIPDLFGDTPFLAGFVVTALDPMGDWRCRPAGRSR